MIIRLLPIAFGPRYRQVLLLASCVVLISSAVQSVVPLLFGQLISKVEMKGGIEAYLSVLGLYCAVVFSSGALSELRLLFLGLLDNVSFFRLSVETYRRAVNSSYEHHLSEESGSIFERLSLGSEAGSTLLQSGLGVLVAYTVQIVFSACFLVLFYGPAMGAVVALCIASFVTLSYVATFKLKGLQLKIAESQALSAGAAITGLESIETVKSLGVEAGVTDQYSQRLASYKRHVKSYLLVKCRAGLASQLIIICALAGGLVIPFMWRETAGIRLEAIVVANLYILQLAIPLEESVRAYFSVLEAHTNVERLGELLTSSTPPTQREDSRGSAIEFHRVGYKRGSSEILRNLTFTIPSGELTLVIGASGAGKSTAAHIMVNLLQPTNGTVGARAFPDRNARYGYVPQAVPLFNDTIRFNVDLGRGYSDERILGVLQRCSLGKRLSIDVSALDGLLGDGGLRLSGGERQRLGLARALILDPDILVLDEVTSGLDGETSRELLSEVVSLTEGTGVTVVMVTHDLSLAPISSHIIVLEDGTAIIEGSYEEVRKAVPAIFAKSHPNNQ